MLLELTVVSYHRLSPRQVAVKTFDQMGGTIGRSESSDWYLPDPERVVSGTHARIEQRGSSFFITDLSTNGLFVNRSVEPLGIDNAQILNDGDFLSLGEYEIEVRVVSEKSTATEPVVGTSSVESRVSSQSNLKPDVGMGIPMSDIAGLQVASSGSSPSAVGQAGAVSSVSTADHISAVGRVESVQSVDAASVSSTLDDHFLPPSPEMIPEEWDNEWSGIEEPSLEPAPLVGLTNTASGSVLPEAVVPNSGSSTAPSLVGSVKTAPISPAVNTSPTPNKSGASAQMSAGDMAAFLKGLGVSSQMIPADASDQWWEQLGVSFQELLMGLMGILRARSTVKSEFRVNQTTFQQKENNPLKFSATVDDVFHNLFNRSGASFLPPRQAIKDAFDDVNRHEEAIMAGAKGSIVGVLKQLSPEFIESKDFSSSFMDKMTPARRQARYWEMYKDLYKDVHGDMSQEGTRAVNDEFTAAYEAALKK